MSRYILLLCLLGTFACSKKHPIATPAQAAPPQQSPAVAPSADTRRQAENTTPRTDSSSPKADPNSFNNAISAINKSLEDAFFDYDKYNLRNDAMTALQSSANVVRDELRRDTAIKLTVEGHCDDRGSSEYNLALGEKRASEAKGFLVQLGLPNDRIKTVSFGEQQPVCSAATDECWQKNRRAHLTYQR